MARLPEDDICTLRREMNTTMGPWEGLNYTIRAKKQMTVRHLTNTTKLELALTHQFAS